MDLCCNVAIPGIPPLERTNRTPRNQSGTAKKAAFLGQVLTKMTVLLFILQHHMGGNMQRGVGNPLVDPRLCGIVQQQQQQQQEENALKYQLLFLRGGFFF